MYVQCKVYIHLWRRLKAYNRVIYVQNRPDTCKKLALEKPPLVEPCLENKEALAPTQSDTNSSQYTETEDYSMEVLHVWPLSPCHRLSCAYYTQTCPRRRVAVMETCGVVRNRHSPSSDPGLIHCPPRSSSGHFMSYETPSTETGRLSSVHMTFFLPSTSPSVTFCLFSFPGLVRVPDFCKCLKRPEHATHSLVCTLLGEQD